MYHEYEQEELKRKIERLESRIDDCEYEIRRLKEDKADVNHNHREGSRF